MVGTSINESDPVPPKCIMAVEDARAALDAVAELYRDSMLEADDWISQLRNRN
jgi:hypothetical protein